MENDKISFRTQGGKSQGRLVRGFVYDSKLKSNISSIPSKFETVVYKTHSQKGFLSSKERFDEGSLVKENPGPGSYSMNETDILSNFSKSSTSFSQKGYGNGFLSKSQRNIFRSKYINSGPSPVSYDYRTDNRELNIARSYCSSFKATKRQTLDELKEKKGTPGPCSYKTESIPKINSYHSSFNSQSKREDYLSKQNNPPPGSYNIRKGLVFKTKNNYPAFAEPYKRKKEKLQMKELVKIVEGEKLESNLGPGDYDPKPFESHVGESNNNFYFQKTAKNRFGDFEDEEKQKKIFYTPGPGNYSENIDKEEEKDLIKGSVFVSTTNRIPFGDFEKKMGPNPKMITKTSKKKSFHMNLSMNWI